MTKGMSETTDVVGIMKAISITREMRIWGRRKVTDLRVIGHERTYAATNKRDMEESR